MPVSLSIASALERSLLLAVCVCALGTLAAIVTRQYATHDITAHRASRAAIAGVLVMVAILGFVLFVEGSAPDRPGDRKVREKSLIDLIYPSES